MKPDRESYAGCEGIAHNCPLPPLPIPLLCTRVRILRLPIPVQPSFPYLTRQCHLRSKRKPKLLQWYYAGLPAASGLLHVRTWPRRIFSETCRRSFLATTPTPAHAQRHANPHSCLSYPAFLHWLWPEPREEGKRHP